MQAELFKEAQKFFVIKKREYLREFNSHNVTREIEKGPFARSNISETLPGLKYEAGSGGNLFSFIGFHSSQRPITELRSALNSGTVLRRIPHSIKKSKVGSTWKWRYVFKIVYPSINDLAQITHMPWEPGSWVKKIETGISNLGYYIWQRKGFSNSRSGAAIQSRNTVRTSQFTPVQYITDINQRVFGGWKA